MPGISDFVLGIGLPALIAAVFLLVRSRAARGEPRPGPLVGALALGLGYLVAHVGLLGWPPVPGGAQQLGARDWIAWFVVAAILLAPVRGIARWKRFSTPVYVALLSVLLLRFTLRSVSTDDARGLSVRLGVTLALYFVWSATDKLARRRAGPAVPACLALTGTGVALAALYAHSFTVAQQAGSVCAGLGAAAVVALVDPRARLPVGAVAVACIVFAGALVNAAIYDLPLASWLLLAFSPWAAWLAEASRFDGLRVHARGFLALGFTALPVAIAVLWAWRAGQAGSPY